MSTTYSLVCDDCKESHWCGQSNYIYDIEKTTKFLHNHVGHRIRFVNDLVDDDSTVEYKEY